MEISPIAGIRVMPVQRLRPVDPELNAFFDVESSARLGDEEDSKYGRKASGAEEEEEAEDLLEAEEAEPEPVPVAPSGRISFFA